MKNRSCNLKMSVLSVAKHMIIKGFDLPPKISVSSVRKRSVLSSTNRYKYSLSAVDVTAVQGPQGIVRWFQKHNLKMMISAWRH